MIWEIAEKIVGFMGQWAGKKLERKHKVLTILKKLGFDELKKDMKSVYVHALVEYAVDANPKELTLLFAEKTLQKAFRNDLYKNQRDTFERKLNQLLRSKKIPVVHHIYKSAADLKEEIQRFQTLYDHFNKKSADALQLMEYNELYHLLIQSMERSFDYQAERYLECFKKQFQKEFLDNNHYIDLNGEIRKERKDKEVVAGVDSTLKEGHQSGKEKNPGGMRIGTDYEAVLYDPLDRLIQEWLKDGKGNLLVILGEYGTGKTTFLRHLAHRLAVHRLESGVDSDVLDKKYRIPLYFPLRDFEKKIEPFIIDQFSKVGISDIDYSRFLKRLENDEFVLLLDGFDEMTQKVDPDEKSRNFDKIRHLIEHSEKSKIILTVRQEYFQSASDIEATFRHRDKPNYSFAHLLPFDEDQIWSYLESHTDDPEHYYDQIERVFDLHDLAKRPVLLQLIVDHLPKVVREKGKNATIAAADLYENCIKDELRRKSSQLNFIIPNRYRIKMLEQLAVWMFTQDQLNFDTGFLEIRELLRSYFNVEMEWEYEKYLNEFLTFSFLIREADYRYRISHKSFRDYLASRAFAQEINSGHIKYFAQNRSTAEINNFIIEQGVDTKALLKLVLNARIENLSEENQWQGTNATTILFAIDPTLLKGCDLSRCRLTSVDFTGFDLAGTDFQNADLSDCQFDKNILQAVVRDANLTNSQLDLSFSGLIDISFLDAFKSISHLDLRRNHISDIRVLKEFKQLIYLNLSLNSITNFESLSQLKNLKQLYLYSNGIKDISTLEEIRQLTQLDLRDNQLTDISALKEFKQLNELDLRENRLTDVSPLKNMKQLNVLDLRDNRLTDISALKELKQLIRLFLHNNQITDISPLKELKNLETLHLQKNGPLSKNQMDALKQTLPNLKDVDF